MFGNLQSSGSNNGTNNKKLKKNGRLNSGSGGPRGTVTTTTNIHGLNGNGASSRAQLISGNYKQLIEDPTLKTPVKSSINQ